MNGETIDLKKPGTGDSLAFLDEADRQRVRPVLVQWEKILQQSVLVEINISKWHPSFSLDIDSLRCLGVEIADPQAQVALRKTVRLGQMDLIPRDVIRRITRIEQQARSLLRSYAHRVLFGYVVHAEAYADWKENHQILYEEFVKTADYIADNLWQGDDLVAKMIGEYRVLFADSYQRLCRAGVEPDRSERQFVEDGIDFVVSHVPDADTVRGKYQFETWLSEAPMVDELARREEQAQQTRDRMVLSRENLEGERQRILEQMERDVEAQAASRVERLERSFAQAEMAFYQSISSAVRDIQQAIVRNNRLGGRSAVQLRNLARRVRSLNVFGNRQLDEDIEALGEKLEIRLNAKGEGKTQALDELRELLAQVETNTRRELRTLPRKRGIRDLVVPEGVETDDAFRRVVRPRFESTTPGVDVLPVPVRRRRVMAEAGGA
jgi:hypothetical protein